jgi:hypothetical protein
MTGLQLAWESLTVAGAAQVAHVRVESALSFPLNCSPADTHGRQGGGSLRAAQ